MCLLNMQGELSPRQEGSINTTEREATRLSYKSKYTSLAIQVQEKLT